MVGNIEDVITSLDKPYLVLDNQITFASITNTSSEVTLLDVYSVNHNLMPMIQTYGKWLERSSVMVSEHSWMNRRSNLTGMHLRCTTMEQLPFIHLSNQDELLNVQIIGGYAGDVWHTLQEFLGFTYKCYMPPDGKFGTKSGEVWSGLVKEVLDDRADVVVTALDHSDVRREVLDFPLSLREVGYQLIIQRPGLMDETWTSFTSELMPASWTATITFTFLVPLCLYICAHLSPLETENVTLKDAYLLTIGALAYQGSWLEVKSTSTRIVFISIFLSTLLIYAHYTSALVSLLTVSSNNNGIISLQDLLKSQNYGFGFARDISIQEEFLNARSGLYHDVWNKLTSGDTEDLPTSNEEGINKVIRGNYVFMMEENIYRARFYTVCDVMVIPGKYFLQGTGFAFRKGSPLLEVFNAQLLKMHTGGILNRLWERWQPPSALCTSEGVISLGLVHIFTAFLVLQLGIALALVFLPCERLHWSIIGKSKYSLKSKMPPFIKVKPLIAPDDMKSNRNQNLPFSF
ncbi:glutamate receptor ionotropic, kainate 2-like [Palaemon carinicauda]|uniref:glutamate receptor ionotropic, kainate 2-like n=1 Tax=Palaemon carinicauda TaxID=392227 RepID=UPI0035B69E87